MAYYYLSAARNSSENQVHHISDYTFNFFLFVFFYLLQAIGITMTTYCEFYLMGADVGVIVLLMDLGNIEVIA